ncbi:MULTISPECIES: DUF4247 domain-containing protein [unclassified Solwaraspora]|uniref:DUF4247 domain-containing protein n=1 Tax=unclassified Solwaraspora TaxID=2627926 RepID=UPI00259BC0DC|nr:DUF4247 domain-containing protein [Solwaraspora sp. WMMA2056]WJK38543.1 DUF4247 domain-containing protein [Solwaraspora sp. WMMA2056]
MTSRKWIVGGVVLALVGVIVSCCGLAAGTFSARGYVERTYARSVSDDIGSSAKGFRSERPPAQVAEELRRSFRPEDQHRDGERFYLRYGDDSVVILPAAVGSLILVERMVTAYPRYRSTVGNSWNWQRGSTTRGGGPGTGK